MGSTFTFALPRTDRSLSDSLNSVPRAFKQAAKRGFAVLAGLGQQHYAELLRAVVITLESRQPPFDDLERLGLSKEDLSALMAAAMITVPLLTSGGTTDEFIATAVKADVLAQEASSAISPFLQVVISERSQISRTLLRTAMPSQILPSLTDFEFDVPRFSLPAVIWKFGFHTTVS